MTRKFTLPLASLGLAMALSACGSGAAEGFVYRWPQHCMAPPQMPAVAQPRPVMWSW